MNTSPLKSSVSFFRLAGASVAAALALVLCLGPAAFAEEIFSATVSLSPAVQSSLISSAGALHSTGIRPSTTLALPTKYGSRQVTLLPFDIRSKSYSSVYTKDGFDLPDQTRVDFFRGTVAGGDVTDFVRLTYISDPVSGKSWFEGFMQSDLVSYAIDEGTAPNSVTVKEVSQEKVQEMAKACGVSENFGSFAPVSVPGDIHTRAVKIAEIATEADFEYVSYYSGNPTTANARIASIMNSIDGVYRAQVNVGFQITYQHAHLSPDPFTSTNPSTLLGEFGSYWANNQAAAHPSDFVHMWTGVDLDGGVIGIAFIGAVCGFSPYGLSQRFDDNSYAVPLTGHEIGHNFDAVSTPSGHDENCSASVKWLMCPSLNVGVSTMSPRTLSDINSFVSSISACLTDDNGGTPPPPGNSPPVLGAIGSRAVNEYATLTVPLSASDPNGDAVTFSASPIRSDLSVSGSTLTFSPGNVVTGGAANTVISIRVTATDSNGATDFEDVPITVQNVNGLPTITSPGNRTVAEGSLLDLTVQVSDPDGDPLIVSSTTLPGGAVLDTSGRLRFRPHGAQSGTYPITVIVRDAAGASASTSFTVTVTDTPGVPGAPARLAQGDLDRDGKCDLTVFRPVDGTWYSRRSSDGAVTSSQFGLPVDVPVPGDYDNDHVTDLAVFRPTDGSWFIKYSSLDQSTQTLLGDRGDLPCPADFDGDGRTDVSVLRASTGFWYMRRSSDGTLQTIQTPFQPGDLCVPGDYVGTAAAELAVYRPLDGTWRVLTMNGSTVTETPIQWGLPNDLPLPADYDGDGRTDLAVYRASEGMWYIRISGATAETLREVRTQQHGLGAHVPFPCDIDGDGAAELGVYDPAGGNHYVREIGGNPVAPVQLGLSTDWVTASTVLYRAGRATRSTAFAALGTQSSQIGFASRGSQRTSYVGTAGTTFQPYLFVAGTYAGEMDRDADGFPDTATYQNGLWRIRRSTTGQEEQLFWGVAGDIPLFGADQDRDGRSDLIVYRPCDQQIGAQCYSAFYSLLSKLNIGARTFLGLPGFIPLAIDYDGDGIDDLTVIDPGSYQWYIANGRAEGASHGLTSVQFGLTGDAVVPFDYDRDGRLDLAVYRRGTWFIRDSGNPFPRAVSWGSATDVPVPGTLLSSDRSTLAVVRTTTVRRKTSYSVLVFEPATGASSTLSPTLPVPSVVLRRIPPAVIP